MARIKALLLCLLLCSAGCLPPGDTSIRGMLQGAIWDSAGPLAGALAWVDAEHFAYTDEDGAFTLRGVEGPLDLHLAADGYRTRTILAWNDTLAQFHLQSHFGTTTWGTLAGTARLPFVPEEEVSVHVHGGGGRSTVTFAPGQQEAPFAHTARAGLTGVTAYTRGALMMDYYGSTSGQLVRADETTDVSLELLPSQRVTLAGSVPARPAWIDGDFSISATLSLGGDGSAYVSSGTEPDEAGVWALDVVSLPPFDTYTVSAVASGPEGDELLLYHPEVRDPTPTVDFPDAALSYPEVAFDMQTHDYDWERVPGATYTRLRLQQRTEEGGWATAWTAEGVGTSFSIPALPDGAVGLTEWAPGTETRARVELYAVPDFDPVLNWSFDALEARLRTRWFTQEPDMLTAGVCSTAEGTP